MLARKVFFFVLGSFFFSTLHAQCINGTRSMPIYEKGIEFVEEFDNLGMEIVKIEYDLVLTKKYTYRYLSPDWKYKIIAFADDGVKDLDIYLYENDKETDEWQMVGKDEGDGANPHLFHIPKEYTEYSVEVVVNEFEDGFSAARYGLIFVHE